MMKTLSQPLFALCAVLFPLFVYAQEDTLNADGLFPKYNRPTYRMSAYDMQNFDKILSGELQPSTPVDSDMIRGAFQRAGMACRGECFGRQDERECFFLWH